LQVSKKSWCFKLGFPCASANISSSGKYRGLGKIGVKTSFGMPSLLIFSAERMKKLLAPVATPR
jgi:hypothetical protein